MHSNSSHKSISPTRVPACLKHSDTPLLRVQAKMILVLTLLMTTMFSVGCSKYGEVSPRTYEISSALYSVCNRKDVSRLDKVEELITSAVTSGDVSSSEQQWLTEIVEAGRSGDWEFAAQEARTIMEEQVQ